MEIILVDNTPRPERRPFNVPSGVRVLSCDSVGLSLARNTGIAAAKGKIVAFVDDDARVREGWCDAVLHAFDRHPMARACGGPVMPEYRLSQLPSWFYPDLTYWLSCIDWGDEARPLRSDEWLVGANMAFQRSVFDEFGSFDPGLGRKGTKTLLSNEETALFRSVGEAHTFYIPDMIVDHVIANDRVRIDWFRKRVFWQAVSDKLGGEPVIDPQTAREEIHELTGRPALNQDLLTTLQCEPRTAIEARKQLRLVYLLAALMADGLAEAAEIGDLGHLMA
jgi:glycosyltransferase involved in cell wall biosynthesis